MCQSTLEKASPAAYRYEKKYHLSDIYRLYFKAYLQSKSRHLFLEERHLTAVNQTLCCRTGKLGYHLFKCNGCQQQKYLYHSCKHRFCGNCGSAETHRWAQDLQIKLLDIAHHHVVFTLPASLRKLAKDNPKTIYDLFFRASSQVLQNYLGYKHGLSCGIVSVLHTAGSDLKYHPHLHLIVSGGGLDISTGQQVVLPGNYLCNSAHLKKRFRWQFEKGLVDLYEKGSLRLSGSLALGRSYFLSYLKKLNGQDWVVSVQPALADKSHIVKYVGRYTKRACLSEYRLASIEAGRISFSYKDYKNSKSGEKPKEALMVLPYSQFLDRLLQHVPFKGFRMVRYYGLYATRVNRKETAAEQHAALAVPSTNNTDPTFLDFETYWQEVYGEKALNCSNCQDSFKYIGQYFRGLRAKWRTLPLANGGTDSS
ncbi:transposase [Rhodocytophaga aerolata]|uniref:Transposase n=1 Tax=Rhodocytophaga aerolata TaxID=455078 RepID=A0ABT8RL60_9BACT|nr:transposase [Rhodocytophaga aerolata]MDO1451767.1 transposase [Rhodocytophaga aerolata]